MAELVTSAFDKLSGLTVDEMLANPHFLPDQLLESTNGDEFYRLFFRDVNSPSNLVGYRELAPDYLEDDVQRVAEFGEIPVSDPHVSDEKVLRLDKFGIALRVSWEQKNDNDTDAVVRELTARRNTVLRAKARGALAAFDAANLQTYKAKKKWDEPGSDPSADFFNAEAMILGAEDGNGHYYDYAPNVLLIHPMTLNLLKRNEKVQSKYVGDMAHANPLFSGVANENLLFGGVQVAASHFVPKNTAYLGVQGRAGFMAQREAEWMSDFYEERGNSSRGGANMSWRSDYVHRRGFAVDAPKSVVKITGLTS